MGGAFALLSRPHPEGLCTSYPTVAHLTLSEKKMSNAHQMPGGGGMNALGIDKAIKSIILSRRNFSLQ